MTKLNNIPKQNNFKVPEGYFENFEKQFENDITVKSNEQTRVSAFQIFKPYIYMAASVLFLVGTLKLFLGDTIKKQNLQDANSKANEKIRVEQLITELIADDMVFYEYLEDIDKYVSNENLENVTKEYIEDYLAQYYIEYELLDE